MVDRDPRRIIEQSIIEGIIIDVFIIEKVIIEWYYYRCGLFSDLLPKFLKVIEIFFENINNS